MTIESYRKNINLHALISFVIGFISLIISILAQFTNIITFAHPDNKTQVLLAVVAVLIAATQYIYTRNILKNRILALVNSDLLEQKVHKYYRLMLQSFYISALSLMLMALICLFVANSLIVGLCALMLLFSVMLLRPGAFRMKMDLQLSDNDMVKTYGKNWNK